MSGPIDDPPPGTGPAPVVRRATPADAAACLRVYAPYVRETTATFEDRVPTVDEFEARHVLETGAQLVARSAAISEGVEAGTLAIVGVTYHLADGRASLRGHLGDIGDLDQG